MTVLLRIVDQVPGAPVVDGPELPLQVGLVTAREIVRARVRTEVERHNSQRQPRKFVGLVQPPEDEQHLNPNRAELPRALDAERQIEVALEAVRKGRVIILFNGEQVTDIDAPLIVTPVSEARFLRLVPLVGG
jgi:hypothetical protein